MQYREALDNPPLLVVCDLDRFEVHTNFTNTPATVHSFTLADRDPALALATANDDSCPRTLPILLRRKR